MKKTYQIATVNGWQYPTLEQLQNSELFEGEYHGPGRECLQGAPLLKGLCGPMYNGTDKDGTPIIRYETQELYATFD